MIVTLIFFVYVMSMCALRPTVMFNVIFNFMTKNEYILFCIYWFPTWIYFGSLMFFFSWISKISVSS